MYYKNRGSARIILAGGGLLSLLIVVIVGVRQYRQIVQLEADLEQARRELKINDLAWSLSPPDEAILCNRKTLREIAEIRKQAWEKEGRKIFLPYYTVMGSLGSPSICEDPRTWKDLYITHYDDSYESFWINRVSSVCIQLAHDLEGNQRLGKYFIENRDVFDKKIRPRVVRLLSAQHGWVVRDACKVLLAAGERSERIRKSLLRIATEEQYRIDAEKLLKKYGWEVPTAVPATQSSKKTGI